MPILVTSGATLRCSAGSTPSDLAVPATRGITAGGRPVATIADTGPLVNIRPFGRCSTAANPAVASAIANGQSGADCIPAVVAPWTQGSSTVKAGNLPVLSSASQCRCQWGGVISVLAPGQQTTMVG